MDIDQMGIRLLKLEERVGLRNPAKIDDADKAKLLGITVDLPDAVQKLLDDVSERIENAYNGMKVILAGLDARITALEERPASIQSDGYPQPGEGAQPVEPHPEQQPQTKVEQPPHNAQDDFKGGKSKKGK